MGAPDAEALAAVLSDLERLRFDTLWMSDVPSLPSTDPFTGVAFAAGLTTKLKLGANFIPFGRQPYLFAHQIAQLDRFTRGRLLVTLVPGLDLPGEREALGTSGRHRGRMMDDLIPQVRRLWAGEELEVDPSTGDEAAVGLRLPVLPLQDPLEIWLGGSGPEAISRAGRLADGWLGSLVSPVRAGEIRKGIEAAAAEANRVVDPEHFGLSVGYARKPEDIDRAVRLRRPKGRDADTDLTELVPIGRDALRDLSLRLVDEGISKFVLRPIAAVESWTDELEWLADAVLDLQS
jgi:probable F420-dependent oxidoreductase